MKKPFYMALALTGLLAVGAQAQPPAHHEGDGHDHSRETKKPSEETTLDYFWRKSDEAFHAGDYPRAIDLHKAIVALDPGDIESYSVAAWLLWSLGKNDEALAHIERGLKANENNWLMWDAAGQHYDLQKRVSTELAPKSREAFARAVQLLPADADKNEAQMLRRRLAHAAEKAGDIELSLATWRDLVRDFPNDAVNKNNLARVEKLSKAGQLSASLPLAVAGFALLAMTGSGALLRRNTSS